MSKTDRQTDRGTCWSITAFGAEIKTLLDKVNVPDYVKEIHGGVERCPETDREHFQGCVVLHTQQRMSALKKWLPTAHLEIARNRDALKKYALKADTAVGQKESWDNPQRYEQLHEWLLKAAKEFVKSEDDYYSGLKSREGVVVKDPARDTYIWATSRLIKQDISMINKYSNPQFIAAWRMYEPVLISAARASLRQEDGPPEADSITASGSSDTFLCEDIIQNATESSSQSSTEAQLQTW